MHKIGFRVIYSIFCGLWSNTLSEPMERLKKISHAQTVGK